ncbi:MAG: hypothetical protein H0U21_01775 [Acidimicrobiia bacterium]|nr:hypothetical protein [Acidimicrobiia bacterium]
MDLGELTADDVCVEAVHGPVAHEGEFTERVHVVELAPVGDGTFAGQIAIGIAGSYGVSTRVSPVHPDLASRFDLGRVGPGGRSHR